jgi:hypothetical protein
MAINEFGNKKNYKANQELPRHLEHKPVYAIPYTQFDGHFANQTDCQYLSIGISQWDEEDISLKTMRHTGDKWSRQSEELPLHRIIDSTILIAKVLLDCENDRFEIERNTFKNQLSGIEIKKEFVENTTINNDFDNALNRQSNELKERLNSLYNILSTLKNKGKF